MYFILDVCLLIGVAIIGNHVLELLMVGNYDRIFCAVLTSTLSVWKPSFVSWKLLPSASAAIMLLTLSDPILVGILSHLDCLSLANLSQTCQRLCSVIRIDAFIWRRLCEQAGVSDFNTWGCASYRDLYTTLLYKYGTVVGLWAGCTVPNGSLLLVKQEPPFISAYSVFATRLNGPCLLRPVFRIGIENGKARCMCTNSLRAQHPEPLFHEAVLHLPRSKEDASLFALSCSQQCKHCELDAFFRHAWQMEGMTEVCEHVSVSGQWQLLFYALSSHHCTDVADPCR